MTIDVRYDITQGVAVLAIVQTSDHAMGATTRAALIDAIDRAKGDNATAILICGAQGNFPSGVDLTPGDLGRARPSLQDVCSHIEACELPVVAMLQGQVFGAGFEIALAAHYRVATPGARASLPEIRLGLIPGGGATQRLPRLVGAALALRLCLSGQIIPLDRAPGSDLVDLQLGDAPLEEALAYCVSLEVARRTQSVVAGFADPAAYQSAIAKERQKLTSDDPSPQSRLVSLIEAAPLLPFEAGLAMEEDAFEAVVAADQSRALRQVFAAELSVRREAMVQGAARFKIARVAVLGGGPLAMQIVVALLNAGLQANWGMRDAARLAEGKAQVQDIFETGARESGAKSDAVSGKMANLAMGESAEMVGGADIIVHAAKGQGNVPAPQGIPRLVAMPGRVDGVGLRFALPVFAARLVELVQGPDAIAHDRMAAHALAEKLGKVGVPIVSTGDSIAARLTRAMHRAADGLIDLGANPYEVDQDCRDWGWSRAPFRARDLAGLAQSAEDLRGLSAKNWSAELIEIDRIGRICGRGFYDWSGAQAAPSATVPRLFNGARQPRTFEPGTLCRLMLGALANEGARMLRDGMARSADQIDLVSVLALDMPRTSGGVMTSVSLMGLMKAKRILETCAHPDRAFWAPDPLWAELIKNGRRFTAA